MSISSASKLEFSLIGFAGLDSTVTLTWQGGDKRKRRRQEGLGQLFKGWLLFKETVSKQPTQLHPLMQSVLPQAVLLPQDG